MKNDMEHFDTIILKWIPEGSKVLDLGCGDGTLLMDLKTQKQVIGKGLEISEEQIRCCIGKGLSVIHADLNDGLKDYQDKSFDYVIMNRTLQIMRSPDYILSEMLRVGKHAIVNYPNFGYYTNRLQLLRGIMPMNKHFPYRWYNTPNIHFCTYKDFSNLCRQKNIEVEKEFFTKNKKHIPPIFPNLLANEIYCMITQKMEKK